MSGSGVQGSNFSGEISPEVVHFLFIVFTIGTTEGEAHEPLKGGCLLGGDSQSHFSAIWIMLARLVPI